MSSSPEGAGSEGGSWGWGWGLGGGGSSALGAFSSEAVAGGSFCLAGRAGGSEGSSSGSSPVDSSDVSVGREVDAELLGLKPLLLEPPILGGVGGGDLEGEGGFPEGLAVAEEASPGGVGCDANRHLLGSGGGIGRGLLGRGSAEVRPLPHRVVPRHRPCPEPDPDRQGGDRDQDRDHPGGVRLRVGVRRLDIGSRLVLAVGVRWGR